MQFLSKNPAFRPLQLSFDSINEVNLLYNLLGNLTLESLMKVISNADEKEINELWKSLTKTTSKIKEDYKTSLININYQIQSRNKGTITGSSIKRADSINEVAPGAEAPERSKS